MIIFESPPIQAYREGLVAALDDDPVAAAMEMASRMASQGPTAVRTCVRTLRNQGRNAPIGLISDFKIAELALELFLILFVGGLKGEIDLNSELESIVQLFQGDDGLEAALWREADAQAQCYATTDLMEGVNAVREKRSPEFTLYEDFKS